MKVLVIDDDVVSRMVLMHLVDSCGSFEIVEAEDGEDAWRQLDGGLRPAITFCDVRMPRMSGIDLLQRVKGDARLATMPFVLVSAANDGETMEQANCLGAEAYIVKPYQAEQVRSHLAGLAPAVSNNVESPAAVMRRLGIDSARLLRYLGGLDKQLQRADSDITRQLASADVAGARERLARLREGCSMLGLTGAAAGIARLEMLDKAALDCAGVERVLDTARQAVLRQSESACTFAAP
jgi:two-component system chemotaxis response regulator CheY